MRDSEAIREAAQVLIAGDQNRLDPPLDRSDSWGDYAERVLRAAFGVVGYRELETLDHLYRQRHTHEQVAERFQITPERVKLIEVQALRKIASQVLRDGS